jgi:prevent-host-death family protein
MNKQEEPRNQVVKASDARQQLPQLLNGVYRGQGRVIIERSGIPVAAIVSPQDLERLKQLEEEQAADFAVLERISQAFADVPAEEVQREVDKAVSEVRAEMRAEHEAQTGAASPK